MERTYKHPQPQTDYLMDLYEKSEYKFRPKADATKLLGSKVIKMKGYKTKFDQLNVTLP